MTAKYDVGDLYDFPDLADPADDYDYAAGSYPFPATTKPWADKLRDNSLVLSSTPLQDDRNTLPRLAVEGDHVPTLNLPASWRPGMTYLSAGCSAALFGVNADGTAAGGGGRGGGGGAAGAFALVHGSTPAFSCRKYRLVGNSPNRQNDEIVTEVVWSGGDELSVNVAPGVSRDMGENELYVGGKGGGVTFQGADLTVSGGDVGYYGNGVLFAETSNRLSSGGTGGNINFTADFTPAANDDWALVTDRSEAALNSDRGRGRMKALGPNVPTTYPATALVSVVARKNVSTDGAQRRLSTTVYAQEEVDVNQQMVLAGSIVTKSFDAGSQVPTVLYVPNLAQNLSRLMPGTGGSTFTLSNTAWNRR